MYISRFMKMSINDEEKFIPSLEQYSPHYFKFGITSIKSAILLNFVLNSKHWFGKKKKVHILHDLEYETIIGGGLFVKSSPHITINYSNDIGIYFSNAISIKPYADLKSTVFAKLADELKAAWNYNQIGNKLKIRRDWNTEVEADIYPTYLDIGNIPVIKDEDTGTEYIEYSEVEYRCLYEFLKNKSKEKITKKYGEEVYYTMIGKQTEDQFVISALNIFKAEIKKVYSEYESEYNKIQETNEKKIQTLKNKEREILKNEERNQLYNLRKTRDEKLKSIQNQIDEILKSAC